MARNHTHQGKKRKGRPKRKKPQAVAPKIARGADRHRLYEESVQEVEADVSLMLMTEDQRTEFGLSAGPTD